MKMGDLRAGVVDDDVFKAVDIKKALEFKGIGNIVLVRDQEAVWDEIDRAKGSGNTIGLIVTDMHYPLEPGMKSDHNAGYILPEQLKERGMKILVIICSTQNFHSPDALGTVWYSKLRDIESDFKEILRNL